MFKEIAEWNKDLELYNVWDEAFARYGRVVCSATLERALAEASAQAQPPAHGTLYVAQAALFDKDHWKLAISQEFFGGLPAEIGYCAGHNRRLTALEYHKCSEILAFNQDVVMMLGRMEDIDLLGGMYQSRRLEAFYVGAGTQLELYPGTLHYGAMETSKEGFCFLVCLAEGTNTPLDGPCEGSENQMLIQKNKWVLCSEDAAEEIAAGAPVWMLGGSISLAYPGA